jgi:iron complex outermembrane receptor protein
MIFRRLQLVGTSVLALSFAATAAHAQQQGGDSKPQANQEVPVSDIVVTARRRSERLLDVPVAITAISGKALEHLSISNVEELTRVASGFNVQASAFGPASLAPSIRGQRSGLPNIVFDSPVNIYFADVVQARVQGLNTALYDLASVQVLKGPQGTLFGRNSTGGALIITPNPAEDTLGGYAKASVGNYDLRHFEGAINVPLSPSLAVRVAGQLTRRDGYVRSLTTGNRLDNERSEGLRGTLRFAPPESGFSTDVVVDYVHRNDAAIAYRIAFINPTGLTSTIYPSFASQYAAQQTAGFYTTSSEAAPKGGTKVNNLGISAISKYEFGNGLTVKNILGYKKVDSFFVIDFDGASVAAVETQQSVKSKQYSDELQVLGTALDDHLNYIGGGYYFSEKGDDIQVTSAFGAVSRDLRRIDNSSKSLFSQLTYKIHGVESVSLTLGGRYTWDKRTLGTSSTTVPGGVCRLLSADVGGTPLSPCFVEKTANFSKFTYTASVDWKPSPDWLIYLKNSTGYRAGGYPAGPKLPSEFVPYKPETVAEFEFGLKGAYRLAGGRARTNLAVYYDNFKQIQRLLAFFQGTAFVNRYINAAKGKIKGFELEQYWEPVNFLELNGSYAYTDASYDSFITPGGLDYSKSPFAGVSKHMVGGSVRLHVPASRNGGEFAAQLSAFYRSKAVGSDVTGFNPATQQPYPQTTVAGYTTLDGRLEWNQIGGKNLSVALWVKNLTKKEYFTGLPMDWKVLGFSSGFIGAPRTFGADLSVKF